MASLQEASLTKTRSLLLSWERYPWDKQLKRPSWGAFAVPSELYNHTGDTGTDFDAFENVNLAGVPELAATQTAMRKILLDHFQNDWGNAKDDAAARDAHSTGGGGFKALLEKSLGSWFRVTDKK